VIRGWFVEPAPQLRERGMGEPPSGCYRAGRLQTGVGEQTLTDESGCPGHAGGIQVSAELLFCPLHGDYVPEPGSTRCPVCSVDPVASSASLRQVRVIGENDLDPGGDPNSSELTPLAAEFPCPVCGTLTPAENFRVETVGEVWTGNAAVWAEEGVCPECYRAVLEPQIREWTDSEWLVHHYEGWRATVETIHNLFVYEESPQENWLLEHERHRVLDVEKTLSSRREHLARCQMTMRDLQGRYNANMTPPPFQMTLASAGEAVSPRVVADLKALHDRDIALEMKRRHESVIARGPLATVSEPVVPELEPEVDGDRAEGRSVTRGGGDGWVQYVAALALVLAAVALVLLLAETL